MGKSKGFTLVEMIITLGIIAVVSVLVFASYNYFSSKKELEADVKKFISVLELAREKARGEDNSICANTTDDVLSYKVRVNTLTSYVMTAECKTQSGSSSTAEEIRYTMKKTTFVDGMQGKEVIFNSNTGTNKSGTCICFQIKSKNASIVSDYICVGAYGTIEERKDTNC